MKLALAIMTLVMLAACANGAPAPPLPTGAWSQLNNWGNGWGNWTPTQAELDALPK